MSSRRPDDLVPEPELGVAEVKRRAVTGVLQYVFRGIVLRLLGFVSTIVLANFLVPEELGVVALGLSFVTIGGVLASGGLGASLIQRKEPPRHDELRATLGLQLAITIALVLAIGSLSIPFGDTWQIAAVMTLSLPVIVVRVPTAIVAQRRLNYTPLVQNDILENVVYHVLTILLVVLGLGAWGIAIATVVKAFVATTALLVRLEPGFIAPSFDPARVRGMMRFGMAFQGLSLVNTGRDSGINFVVAGVGGSAALGLWNLVWRLLQSLTIVLQSLYRVTFNAMARMIDAGEAAAPLIARGLGMSAVAVGSITVALGASAPALVPSVFGAEWTEAAPVVTLACAALTLNAPISTCAVGYMLAIGESGTVLRCAFRYGFVWLALSAALMPFLGVAAVGYSFIAASTVDLVQLAVAVRRHAGLDVRWIALPPIAVAMLAGGESGPSLGS